jgi:hypothetical protein
MFATENGELTLNPTFFKADDTLRISYTGYADTLIRLPVERNQIGLIPVSIPLQDVEVYPCLDTKNVTLKNYIKHKVNYSFGRGVLSSFSYAAYVPNKNSIKGTIESITIEQSYLTAPSNARKAPFKIRLLHFDSGNLLPGLPLIAKEWLVYPTSNKTTLDVSEELLRLPTDGIVVCIDLFYAGEQYAYKVKVQQLNSDGTKKNEWQTRYGAYFRAVNGENLIGYGYMAGKANTWIAMKGFGEGTSAIMVKLNVKQCNRLKLK